MNTENSNSRFADSRLAHSRFAATQLAGVPTRMYRQQTDDQRKAFALALLIHGFLFLALAWGVSWKRDAPLSVEAELWASVPQEAARAAATPEPQPEPPQAAKPPPPPPVAQTTEPRPNEADIVMERERKAREVKEKAERERQARLERERKEREERERQAAEEKRKQEELLAQKREQEAAELREKLRQENIRRMMGQADASSRPTDAGQTATTKGPSADYAGRVRARIRPHIVFPDNITTNPTAEVQVEAAPDGLITSHKLVKSSGNTRWDQAVMNAITKTERLPQDTDGTVPPVFVITFRPKD